MEIPDLVAIEWGSPDRPASGDADADRIAPCELIALLDELAAMRVGRVVFDSACADEADELAVHVEYASRAHLAPAVVWQPSSDWDDEVFSLFRRSQLDTLIVPVDCIHERAGSPRWSRALRTAHGALDAGLRVETRTRLRRSNYGELSAMGELFDRIGIEAWQIDFVPEGASGSELLSLREMDEAFDEILAIVEETLLRITLFEAPQFRAFLSTRSDDGSAILSERVRLVDARSTLLVTRSGDLVPSASLRLSGGNIRTDLVAGAFALRAPFQQLRDRSALKGACGICDLRESCGGSRVRAWLAAGDLLAHDPACPYGPAWAGDHQRGALRADRS